MGAPHRAAPPEAIAVDTSSPNPAPNPASASRRTAIIGGVVAVIGIAAVLLILTFRPTSRDGEGEGKLFVIPAGTIVERPTIDSAIEMPTEIRFAPGEFAQISIRNDDRVAQRAGPWVIAPGQTLTERFPEPGDYFFACSVDPAESVTVVVEK